MVTEASTARTSTTVDPLAGDRNPESFAASRIHHVMNAMLAVATIADPRMMWGTSNAAAISTQAVRRWSRTMSSNRASIRAKRLPKLQSKCALATPPRRCARGFLWKSTSFTRRRYKWPVRKY